MTQYNGRTIIGKVHGTRRLSESFPRRELSKPIDEYILHYKDDDGTKYGFFVSKKVYGQFDVPEEKGW